MDEQATIAGDDWDQTYRDLGYDWCRVCQEWHRPPECAICSEHDGSVLDCSHDSDLA